MSARAGRGDDYVKRIERFLGRHRIDGYRFERRRKHRAVIVAHRGKVATVIFPVSGSDRRGPRNAVSTLRRALGLIGGGYPQR
jgi:hypothetical protein